MENFELFTISLACLSRVERPAYLGSADGVSGQDDSEIVWSRCLRFSLPSIYFVAKYSAIGIWVHIILQGHCHLSPTLSISSFKSETATRNSALVSAHFVPDMVPERY